MHKPHNTHAPRPIREMPPLALYVGALVMIAISIMAPAILVAGFGGWL